MKKIIYHETKTVSACRECPFSTTKFFADHVAWFCEQQLDAKTRTYPRVEGNSIHPGCPLKDYEETDK